MGRRRIEMFQYRQVLVRLREGDSDRQIARSGRMGREKVASFRGLAMRDGWLDAERPMPTEKVIAAAVGTARRARSTVSTVEPWREQIAGWLDQGVQGKANHAALCRDHSLRRLESRKAGPTISPDRNRCAIRYAPGKHPELQTWPSSNGGKSAVGREVPPACLPAFSRSAADPVEVAMRAATAGFARSG